MTINIKPFNNEVFFATDEVPKLTRDDFHLLKEKADASPRQRARICLHKAPTVTLQEMIIVLTRKTYIRPHRHLERAESIHVLEGEADAVFFSDDGSIVDVVPMKADGKAVFLYRIDKPVYHNLLIKSDYFVFKESTVGPFDPSKSIFAPWAPTEDDAGKRADFITRLSEDVRRWKP